MSKSGSPKLLVVAMVWLVIVGVGVGIYKFIYAPKQEQRTIDNTSAPSKGKHRVIPLALDAFSGYAVLRSQELEEELDLFGLELDLRDDGADYARRIRSLQSGETPVAVFTIDALIKAAADLGKLPGTIVMVIDESSGADALVAYKKDVPPVDALNRADARILVTADSPSETLVRIVRNSFELSELGDGCLLIMDGPAAVLRQLQSDPPSAPRAYALWEPFVSKALKMPNVVRVTDTSKVKGFIVDVLVAQRLFLEKNPEDVSALIQAYLRAYYSIRRSSDGMVDLVQSDARKVDETLTEDEARSLCRGIKWKNTTENYAHMGIVSGPEAQGLEGLERMIRKITRLLVRTSAIAKDPTDGRPNILYYDRIFQKLRDESFHPGVAGAGDAEGIQGEMEARALSAEEWSELVPVVTLDVDRIGFRRGSYEITESGETSLDQLIKRLEEWPQSYLVVRGHASSRGDPEANRQVARDRAEAVRGFLLGKGVSANRLLARGEEPRPGSGQHSVTFLLSEMPY